MRKPGKRGNPRMNLLIIRPEDLSPERRFTVTGERAEHIRTVLRAKIGDPVKTGFLNGKTGVSTLLELEKGRAVLEAGVFAAEPPKPLPLSLIVSLPRPQSFKKVLHFAVSSGIKQIIFTHSAKVEKSYWNSTVLVPESIHAEVIEGLEQGFDTVMPEIRFYRYLKEFFADAETLFPPDSLKIIAPHTVLAIGPEAGYVNSEVEAFASAGFIPAAFGSHILRVEFAAAFIAGFLMHR